MMGFPRIKCGVNPSYAADLARVSHNFLLAISAPSTSAASLAQAMAGSISSAPAKVANPQSEPAITFSRPTALAYLTMR